MASWLTSSIYLPFIRFKGKTEEREAEKRKHEYVTIEHVLLALIKDETIGTTLNEFKIVVGALIKDVEDYLDGGTSTPTFGC